MIAIVLAALVAAGLGAATAMFRAMDYVMDRAISAPGAAWAAWIAAFFVVVALYVGSIGALFAAGAFVVSVAT
ncbi:MAG: hypothetical protein EKK62_17310 [Acidimicrobiia bacterium]|nr:MAG: hypothetical protein EKK62_17310 [Acidimicrobiia bacterium]